MMISSPILVAGLGNPGPEYRGTWHNLGFRAVEKLAAEYNLSFKPGKGEYFIARKTVAGRPVVLLKPTSYMNISGRPILDFVESGDLFHENILVVCDDINLPLGRLRLRGKGSDGGHNGLESVIYYLGTENFPRLRLGIRIDEVVDDLKDYVLSEIPQKLAEPVVEMVEKAANALDCFVREGLETAMNLFNRYEEPSVLE